VYPAGPPPTSTPAPRRRRRFGRLGCLGSLVVVLLLAVVVGVFVTGPWALHIGGQFTPLWRWSGISRAHSPDGSDVGIQLNLSVRGRPSCSRLTGACSNLRGNAVVCTKAGRFGFSNLDGTVGGYLSTDGQPMTITFGHGDTTLTRYLSVTLKGTWHGSAYDASDGGYLARAFAPDGSPRTAVTSPDPAKAAAVSIRPGDFAALCRGIGTPG
jgi:hypothetical protein